MSSDLQPQSAVFKTNSVSHQSKTLSLQSGFSFATVFLGADLDSDMSKTKCFATHSSNRVGNKMIFDPSSKFIQNWNKFFFVASLAAVFVDPLFIYLTVLNIKEGCHDVQQDAKDFVTVLRTITDIAFLFHIILQFRTAYIAPSSTILGRGELVQDTSKIAKRYLRRNFLVDFVAILPLPQIVIWAVIPAIKHSTPDYANNAWRAVILISYMLRLHRILLLIKKMIKLTGVITETAYSSAAYNLFLYILASHVLGACWYSLAIQRQFSCWNDHCRHEIGCNLDYLHCGHHNKKLNLARQQWFSTTQLFEKCSVDKSNENLITFDFGIFQDAVIQGITSNTNFLVKYLYCFSWGLKNLSSYGQGLQASPHKSELVFAIVLSVLGFILFALLIQNMKRFLQCVLRKIEEMRLQLKDVETWMHHRRLPHELQDRVRRSLQYKWVTTRGVDEESTLESFPVDLRREIKRHLCLELVRRVPLFAQMNDKLVDVMCDLLKPTLHTAGSYIIREGDPVYEMTFVIRGKLKSVTTNGGKAGFFNSGYLGPGDFCGEELLNWALDLKRTKGLPTSTRTVKALVEVEAFFLEASKLEIVASQFKRSVGSKQLQHVFKLHSHQWRTWAASCIQEAWACYKRRKLERLLREMQNNHHADSHEASMPMDADKNEKGLKLRTAFLCSKFVTSTLRGLHRRSYLGDAPNPRLQKPEEPDFSS